LRITTTRFGELEIVREDILAFKDGPLGFEGLTRFSIVDPGDATLILWLQSTEDPAIAFPILEPKIFKPDYSIKLLLSELNSLNINKIEEVSIYTILTIPQNVTEMSANLKAPIVINNVNKMARQIVLQDSKLDVRYKMYFALKGHISTIASNTPAKSKDPVLDLN
jgi:flagellar assembly factor FliW